MRERAMVWGGGAAIMVGLAVVALSNSRLVTAVIFYALAAVFVWRSIENTGGGT